MKLLTIIVSQLYKIDPAMLDSWARVLGLTRASQRRVRLWLLRFPAEAAARLVKEAAARGLGEGDLIWSARLGKDDHMRRVRKCLLETVAFLVST